MIFVETIVSTLGKEPVVDPYHIMDLTDDLAQITNIAKEIEMPKFISIRSFSSTPKSSC